MPAAVQTVEPTSSARSGLLRGGGPPCVAIFLVLSEGSQQLHFIQQRVGSASAGPFCVAHAARGGSHVHTGSIASFRARSRHDSFTPMNGHFQRRSDEVIESDAGKF
jgi:hypothetical protein